MRFDQTVTYTFLNIMKTRLLIPLVVFLQAFSCMAQQKAVLTFAEAKQLADRGDARAQAIVAMHYQLGWHTKKNEALAGRYAQASAEAGHPLGIYRLGNLLVSGINGQKDLETGYKLQASSFNGVLDLANPKGIADPYAQTALGIMYFQGKVCSQDKVIAVKAYQNAAVQTFAPAAFNFIMAEIEGQGIKKNEQAFLDYFAHWDNEFARGCPQAFYENLCASCRAGNFEFLKTYPPAVKFYNDNKEKAGKIKRELHANFAPPKLDEKYWKGKITEETALYVPEYKLKSASEWVEIIRAKMNTGEVVVEARTNYKGMAYRGHENLEKIEKAELEHRKLVSDADYDQKDVSSLGNGDLTSTMQYLLENGTEGISISPNTPLRFKNRMGIIEFPISLEVKITNNSSEDIDLNRLGLYVKKSEKINEFLPTLICDPYHPSIKRLNKYAMIFHNSGWDDTNVAWDATISSWTMGTSQVMQKNTVFNSISSTVHQGADFLNQELNPGPHGGMDGVICRVDYVINPPTRPVFFDIDMSRKPSDFFTKVKGDTTLPAGRANIRSVFNLRKRLKPKEIAYANVSFDFNRSAKVLLTPEIDINSSLFYGKDINVLYETPRYYYNPISTFTIDGNGDADTLGVQLDIVNSYGENDLISNEFIAKPLIQSASKVSVLERPLGFELVHEELSADGTKKATIHMARTENRAEGFFQIVSSDERNVLFSAPFSFGNTTSKEVGLSFAINKNWNWASWLLQHGLEKRLYIAFPGRNQTVFTLSNLNANDTDSLARREKSENDINQIGIDDNGDNLVLSFEDGAYFVPLASRLAVSLQETIKSLGTGIVSVLAYKSTSDSRVPLLMQPIKHDKSSLLSKQMQISLESIDNKNQISGISWPSDYNISIKHNDKWLDWNLLSGTITHAAPVNFDSSVEALRSKSQNLLLKINEPRKPFSNMDARCQDAYVIQNNNYGLLVGMPGKTRGNQQSDNYQNGLKIEWYNLNEIEFWPVSSLTISPFGGGTQYAEFSQFFPEISISLDGKMAVAAEKSGNILHLIDLENKKVLAAVVRSQGDPSKCSVVFEDGYYLSGDGLAQGIALSDGFNAMSVAQLEVKYNRPDIVLERLGAPKETVDEAKRLRQRLARRSDFKNLEGASLIDVPVVTLPTDTPSSTGEKNLKISYSATNSSGNLKELLVYNNGAMVSKSSLLGKNGEPGLDAEGVVDLHLPSGENKIQLCAVNEDGVPSNFAEKLITCTAEPAARETYIVTCGVSDYKNSSFNLRYAAKDAGDAAEALKKSAESRGFTPKVLTLKNGEVDSETVSKIRNFLASATADDEVFLFFAGHGLLDKELNYHYAKSDTDFSATENIGIQFDELESLVDCIKPLKRTVLFDTCHSGEVEEESKADVRAMVAGQAVDQSEASNVQSTKIATRGMKVNVIAPKVSHSELINLEKLFPDSRRAKGANILTSSSGSEFSMESAEWNNGLFTYSLLKALQDPATDENKDGYISFSEAAENVKKKVTQLSGGKQRPITRGVNREQDPILVSFNPAKPESPAPKTPQTPPSPATQEKKDEKKSWWSFGS